MGNKVTSQTSQYGGLCASQSSNFGKNEASSASLSFRTFGEATSTPIDIRKAVFDVANPAPFLRRSLVSLKLTVANTAVRRSIGGKLRISLPVGAAVKKFEVLRQESGGAARWYPAVAVPKKKAKEVVYREKEKGRDVAAVSDVASGSNVFEIDVSPLPFNKEVKCRLECMIVGDLEEFQHIIGHYFPDAKTEIIVLPAETESPEQPQKDENGAAVVGTCFGKKHFVCRLPPLVDQNGSCSVNTINHMAVVWDTSGSMEKTKPLFGKRFESLRELATKCKQECGLHLTFELYTFSVGAAVHEGAFGDVETLVGAINGLQYDGGTDVTCLSSLFSDLAQDDLNNNRKKTNAVLVFTDGMDMLGRLPSLDGVVSLPFPVHVVADGKEANLPCLRALAAASPQHPGRIFLAKDHGYTIGLLYPRAVLKSIKTDQSEDALVEEIDDGFRCVPDHRLARLDLPIGPEGLLVSGTLGDDGADTVSEVIAEVSFGAEIHEYCFRLGDSLSGKEDTDGAVEATSNVKRHSCRAVTLGGSKHSKRVLDPVRILGHIHAEEVYRAAEAFGLKSGMDVEEVKEGLSLRYGFCSPESSLLMLYTLDQFLDNDVLPPTNHPIYDNKKAATALEERALARRDLRDKRDGSNPQATAISEGEPGGPKTKQARRKVLELASTLKNYMDAPSPTGSAQSPAVGCRGWGQFGKRGKWFPCDVLCDNKDDTVKVRWENKTVTKRLPKAKFLACSVNAQAQGYGEEEEEEEYDLGGGMCMFGDDEYDEEDEDVVDCSAKEFDLGAACTNGSTEPINAGTGAEADISRRITGRMSTVLIDTCPVAPPCDPKHYAEIIDVAMEHAAGSCSWKTQYHAQRTQLQTGGEVSPSFFLTCAKLALKHNKIADAIRIGTNCLEMNIENVQMLRSVGYFLLSTKNECGADLARFVFDKVQNLQPCEPQSYLDSALVRFWELSRFANSTDGVCDGKVARELKSKVTDTQELICHVLSHEWASRFNEVEWPALILLHYVAEVVKEINEKMVDPLLPGWPSPDLLGMFDDRTNATLHCANFDLTLMVWLGWDTDHTDLDLHVVEPTGNEVYFGNALSITGGRLSRDFTQGYGPEVYVLRESMVGDYDVYARFYASHQDSVLTGTTSAVLWTIEKSTEEGGGNKRELDFHMVRLDTHKEKTRVGTVKVA